jgi:CubicO group peptidase (beta-lactamase class C family)
VEFKKGTNRLLAKVLNQRIAWALSCRLLGEHELSRRLAEEAYQGHRDEIELLVKHDVRLDGKSKLGYTALQAARIRGYEDIAKRLLAAGAKDEADLPTPEDTLDALLSDLQNEDSPAVSVLVSRDGEVLLSKSYGNADLAHHVAATGQTKFRIGSVSKQFTAAAILKLQEDGKLNVKDPLSKFLPDFPRGDEVTVHHLLTHTSGIKSYTDKPDFYGNVAASIRPEELIESFKNDPYDFAPGEGWHYNNSGYFLLGYIVAKVSDMSFDEYLKKQFFDPLHMNDTGVHTSTAILKHEATGYSFADGKFQKALDWDMSRAGGAGALYSTVEDLHKWNEAVFGGNVLSSETLQAAFTPVELKEGVTGLRYGYGWVIDQHRGLRRIVHGGGLHGFLSVLARYPDENLTVVVLHNASPAAPGINPSSLADLLAETYLWQKMKPQVQYVVNPDVDPKTYRDFVGRYNYGQSAVLIVTVEDNRLFAQLTGQPKFEIYPKSANEFFWKVVDATVTFVRNEKGEVIAAKHEQGGVKFEAPKLKDESVVKLDPKELDKFVGKYDYKGLGVLTVTRKGDQLLAQMQGQPEFPIYPKSPTEFFWKVVQAEINFVLDDDGTVTKAIHKQAGQTIEVRKIE